MEKLTTSSAQLFSKALDDSNSQYSELLSEGITQNQNDIEALTSFHNMWKNLRIALFEKISLTAEEKERQSSENSKLEEKLKGKRAELNNLEKDFRSCDKEYSSHYSPLQHQLSDLRDQYSNLLVIREKSIENMDSHIKETVEILTIDHEKKKSSLAIKLKNLNTS